tara:strand:+ start:444 stop:1262 length:819 start_codon:yes stop_codon:yes gene_type:complete
MLIGITGSNGFIGKSFLKKYIHKFPCIPIERKLKQKDWSFCHDIDFKESSILHTADQSNVKICEEEGLNGFLKATDNLKYLLDNNPQKIVYLSSCLVYKRNGKNGTYTENSCVEESNWYTRRKIESEKIILTHPHGVVVRMSNVYGQENMFKNIFGDIDKQISKNSSSVVTVKSLDPVRDFIYIDDIVEALSLLLTKKSNGIYNLGSGVGTSVKQLISLIAAEKKAKVKEIQSSGKVDESEIIIDAKKFQHDFSWTCKTPISEGVRKILNKR